MNKFEILAPAGSWESVIAGVRCGANALYLGGEALNARRNAGNFNNEELKNATEYCHSHGVKVYEAVNTVLKDGEFSEALNEIEYSLTCGVDAFIVQDLGLARAVKATFPEARLHASTQCSVMTPKGFEALEKMGFSRAVLPREMSADEIKEIRNATKAELEMFVHGALCMCVSGQCYFSAMLGSRSGNRGLCAQTCRLPFSANEKQNHDLSLKDLSLINKLKQIEDLGVISLKIEGRMKRPEYVAAAVTAVKKAVDGEYTLADENNLRSVFSRSGFTNGYFEAKLGKNMFGTRQKEDVVAAAGVLKDYAHLYDNETPLLPIDINFKCKRGECAVLTASALERTATVDGPVPEIAVNKPMTEESVSARLSKLGGTQFYARHVNVDLGEGLILPASEINAMRRKAVEALSKEPPHCVLKNEFELPRVAAKNETPYYTARFGSASQVPKNHPFKRVFIPIWEKAESFKNLSAGVEVPRALFGAEEAVKARLTELKGAGVQNALCGNVGAYELAKSLGFNVFGDFGLNVTNSITAGEFNSPVLSFELTLNEANRINAPDTGVIVWGNVPLMLTRNCPAKNHTTCDKCKKNGVLTDRQGAKFKIQCSAYPAVEILNSVPIYLGDKMENVKTDFAHFYFTNETKEQVLNVIGLFDGGLPAPFNFTRGLYFRGVL